MDEQQRRQVLGVERVGQPIAETCKHLMKKANGPAWRGKISMKRLLGYSEGFLFSVFPELIDRSARSLEHLESMDPGRVTEVLLILMRDVLLQQFQGHPNGFRVIDDFFAETASELGADPEVVLASEGPFPIESMSEMAWAERLMSYLGLSRAAGALLFVPHASFARESAITD